MGRPTKLTPDVQRLIVEAVAAGNYYEAASERGGIDYKTFRRWMVEGEAAKSGAKRDFFLAVSKAQADAEVAVVAHWRRQIPDNWQAARDFLARRFPERWGPKDKLEMSGAVGGSVKHTFEPTDDPDVIAAGLNFLDLCAARSRQDESGGSGDVAEQGAMA
jgi:hypothetical protein